MTPPPAGDLAGSWGGDPGVLALVLGAGALYGFGMRRRPARMSSSARDFAFAGLLLILIVALASPVDAFARYLLWVHMAQHVLLVQVAAPLLVLAAPIATMQRALPRSTRRAYASVARRPAAHWVRRAGHNTIVGFFAFAAAWWLWHLPALYDAAVRDPWLHAMEHLTLFGAAVLWWACIIGPRRAPAFKGLALAFLTALHLNVLGALITLAPRGLYGAYSGAYGVSALEDQQLGGMLMWVTGGFLSLVLAAWFVHELLREETPAAPAPASLVSP